MLEIRRLQAMCHLDSNVYSPATLAAVTTSVATPASVPYPRSLRDSSDGMITAGDTAANRYPMRGGASC
jgi:hypothetical protein